MRIVLVCRCYPTQRPGGMLFVCQDRANQLAVMGHDVHVLTTSLPGNIANELPVPVYSESSIRAKSEVIVHHLPCQYEVYSQEFADAACATTRKLAPDVLHFDSADFSRPWWREAKSSVSGRIGITLHGFGMGDMLTQWNMYLTGRGDMPKVKWDTLKTQALALREFDRVIGISLHETDMLRRCYGVDAVHIRNPISDMFFDSEPEWPSHSGVFLCAAVSGHKQRNFQMAAEAAKLAGVELQTISNVPRERMPALYADCCGLILPTSYGQGFDLTVAEAAACGRATLCTDTGSYGFLTEPHRRMLQLAGVDEWANALRCWLPIAPEELRAWAMPFRASVHAEHWCEVMRSDGRGVPQLCE